MTTPEPLRSDLDSILSQGGDIWGDLRGAKIFITGGTGFFGCWLLESFLWANRNLNLGAKAVLLARDEAAFRKRYPRLGEDPSVDFHPGDVRSFDFPEGNFSHIIHAAADTSPKAGREEPERVFDVIVQGTRRTLEFARACSAKEFLLVSSGAVYGKQGDDATHMVEDCSKAPNPLDISSVYGEGKRAAELLCSIYSRRWDLDAKIARGFAFVGPYMSFDTHYAIGNFIRDAAKGDLIQIQGDGTAYRSYLYGADLAVWLWTILLRGETCRPYNVGSEMRVSIAELARIVGDVVNPGAGIRVMGRPIPGEVPEQYVPSVDRARKELGLRETVDLRTGIKRTADWLLSRGEGDLLTADRPSGRDI